MALDLDAVLLYYIVNNQTLSYHLRLGETVNYPHQSQNFPVGTTSLVSYNDFLGFPVFLTSLGITGFAYAKIRSFTSPPNVIVVRTPNLLDQLYMIRDERQPFPCAYVCVRACVRMFKRVCVCVRVCA